jgi:formylglycine-generating enzyme required for sulfatase activity
MAVSLLLFVIGILNLDLFLRLYHAYQNGKLTREDITYEIASYDIKTPLPVIPKSTKISPIDGMTQIFIPAGEFLMGNGKNPKTDYRQHQVYLDSYWIDKVVITNAMYAKCLKVGACTHPAAYDTYFAVWAYRVVF